MQTMAQPGLHEAQVVEASACLARAMSVLIDAPSSTPPTEGKR